MKVRSVLVASAIVLSPVLAWAVDGPQAPLPTEKITIVSAGGARHSFDAEMATTPQEQETGLMYRREIPATHGMFFDWGTPREVPDVDEELPGS